MEDGRFLAESNAILWYLANDTHLRPEYLKDFIAAVEGYWEEMDGLTRVHRSQVGPKTYDLASAKAKK